jgi:hypothetical protein
VPSILHDEIRYVKLEGEPACDEMKLVRKLAIGTIEKGEVDRRIHEFGKVVKA